MPLAVVVGVLLVKSGWPSTRLAAWPLVKAVVDRSWALVRVPAGRRGVLLVAGMLARSGRASDAAANSSARVAPGIGATSSAMPSHSASFRPIAALRHQP